MSGQALTWTFTFIVGIFTIFSELSHFSILGGTSSILRTFLDGTSQKKHPLYYPWFATGSGIFSVLGDEVVSPSGARDGPLIRRRLCCCHGNSVAQGQGRHYHRSLTQGEH